MKSCEGCYYYSSVGFEEYEDITVCNLSNSGCDGYGCDGYTTAEELYDELKPKYRKLKSLIHSIKCIAYDNRNNNIFGDILTKIEKSEG